MLFFLLRLMIIVLFCMTPETTAINLSFMNKPKEINFA